MKTSATTEAGEDVWIKVSLDGEHCVQHVNWYMWEESPRTNWTCHSSVCSCYGQYCEWAFLSVSTGGVESDQPALDLDCQVGDTVIIRSIGTWSVQIYDIGIIAMGKIIR